MAEELQSLREVRDQLREERDRLRQERDRLREERTRLREGLAEPRLVPSDAPTGGLIVQLSVVTSAGWRRTAFEALPKEQLAGTRTASQMIETAAHNLAKRMAHRYADEQDEEMEPQDGPDPRSE